MLVLLKKIETREIHEIFYELEDKAGLLFGFSPKYNKMRALGRQDFLLFYKDFVREKKFAV